MYFDRILDTRQGPNVRLPREYHFDAEVMDRHSYGVVHIAKDKGKNKMIGKELTGDWLGNLGIEPLLLQQQGCGLKYRITSRYSTNPLR